MTGRQENRSPRDRDIDWRVRGLRNGIPVVPLVGTRTSIEAESRALALRRPSPAHDDFADSTDLLVSGETLECLYRLLPQGQPVH